MDGCERIDEKPQGMFYRSLWWAANVLTKIWNRDTSGWTWLSGILKFARRLREVPLSRGQEGDLQNKGL